MRYIELNPVRAGMVDHPADYQWSSFRCNTEGEPDGITQHHEIYQALAYTPEERRRCYHDLFKHHLEGEDVERIRASTFSGTPMGNQRFQAQIERASEKRVGQIHRGRPRNTAKEGKGL